jgi:hypothetical protein
MNALIALIEVLGFMGLFSPIALLFVWFAGRTEWGKKFFNLDESGDDDDE